MAPYRDETTTSRHSHGPRRTADARAAYELKLATGLLSSDPFCLQHGGLDQCGHISPVVRFACLQSLRSTSLRHCGPTNPVLGSGPREGGKGDGPRQKPRPQGVALLGLGGMALFLLGSSQTVSPSLRNTGHLCLLLGQMTRLPLPWKDGGAGGECCAPLGAYCSSLCPLHCHPP